ncbi:MAG: nucleotide exchange factor GrpE [Phycisphaerae bacterium]|jgi:molecular chaperone GrpE|nr:nucleotide exchange factor GrpE [Phycisphaerae bacterium]HJN71847.1 nucleotide exchange factor GrpE [Phycisphaerales bacterium]|tara:strand:+ start:1474 stop:1998 length:525 start_codon:yes stop_codon:yes gene_type:complete
MMTEHPEEQVDMQETELPTEEAATEEPQLCAEDQLRLELHEANEAKLRALADFKNYQRRSIENEARAVESGMVRVVRSILPSVEQMNLAIAHGGDAAVVQGFQMALDELMKGLSECGVSTIAPETGDAFDPQMHEAMMRQEVEGVETDHVVSLMQTGFRLGDIVLQPAKVSVGG